MRREYIFMITILAVACGGIFNPDISDLSEGDIETDDSGSTDTETNETGTGDSDTETNETGTGDSDTETDETDTDTGTDETDTDTGGPGGLEPYDPCDPLLELQEIEVCPEGHSCSPRTLGGDNYEFQCLSVVDDFEPGVEVGDTCASAYGQHASCHRSGCGQDFFAPNNAPWITETWAEFCSPIQGDMCCTNWCDPNDPVQCDAGWECVGADWWAPYGVCVPTL